jgi:hypothetical protein
MKPNRFARQHFKETFAPDASITTAPTTYHQHTRYDYEQGYTKDLRHATWSFVFLPPARFEVESEVTDFSICGNRLDQLAGACHRANTTIAATSVLVEVYYHCF